MHGFHIQRDQYQIGRAVFFDIFGNIFDAVIDGGSYAKKLCGQMAGGDFIGMVHGKHREQYRIFIQLVDNIDCRIGCCHQISLGEHDTLAGPGRAGGEDDDRTFLKVLGTGFKKVVALLYRLLSDSKELL